MNDFAAGLLVLGREMGNQASGGTCQQNHNRTCQRDKNDPFAAQTTLREQYIHSKAAANEAPSVTLGSAKFAEQITDVLAED